uniref:Immunoglobulin domain-containing protein n=1 Tax=Cyprinus carpio TaxID=7962 RepID=A0A8C2EMZ7_CYPCA
MSFISNLNFKLFTLVNHQITLSICDEPCFCLFCVFGDTDEISMKEGDSVTLNSDLTEIDYDDRIQWRFENSLIAEINVTAGSFTVYEDVLDGRFRDRLKPDNKTGSLTITNIRTEHAGVYRVQINRMSIMFFLAVNEEISVMEGDSVTLNSDLTEIMNGVWINWLFGAEITSLAETNRWDDGFSVYDDVLDGRFRDRLKLDNQTGSLTITNITTEHAGRYYLHIAPRHFSLNQSLKAFSVSVYDSVHCCGSTEAVIRLVLSALVGVATVILLVYDIRSRRAEQDQAQIHDCMIRCMIDVISQKKKKNVFAFLNICAVY